MRKVEARMIQSIRHLANWPNFEGRYLNCGNTTVWQESGVISVQLHGNIIATFWPSENRFMLFDCGWQSVTTKSRLNAILRAFSPHHAGIHQEKFCWYVGRQEWESGAEFTVQIQPDHYIWRMAEKLAG